MGGMGFGKRAYDFYNPDNDHDEEQQDYYDELDEAELERLEEAAKILDMEEKAGGEVSSEAEKRSLSSLRGFRSSYKRAGESPEQDPEEKRSISSLKGKRGISSLKGKVRRKPNVQ